MGVPLNPDAPEWRPTLQRHSLFPQLIFPHLLYRVHHHGHRVALPPQQNAAVKPPQPPMSCSTWKVTVSGINENGFSAQNGIKQHPRGSSSAVSRKRRSSRFREAKVAMPNKRLVKPTFQLVPRERVWAIKNSGNTANKVDNLLLRPFPSDGHPDFTKTTVMIKNTPNQIRRDFMLKFLDKYCKKYTLAYDFLYLPMDFGRRQNLGYAFVNFTTPAAAVKFSNVLRNFEWSQVVYSKKICDISWARIQGKEALINRFKGCGFDCDDADFLPVILKPPRDGSDPDPPEPVVVGRARFHLPETLT